MTIQRTCRDCRQLFEITDGEQDFFRRLAEQGEQADRTGGHWFLPARCHPCRQAKRLAKLAIVDDGEDERIVCAVCGQSFLFSGTEKAAFAARGFLRPRRCRDCRRAA